MAPGSIFHHISFRSTLLISYLLCLQSFTFRSINQKYQKHYFAVYPSLSDLTLQIIMKGLTTPLSRWVQVGVCLCRYSVTCALSPTGLIPWFSKLREILTLLCCITLSSSREKPMQAQEVATPRCFFGPLDVFWSIKIPQKFRCIWTLFGIDFLRCKKHAKNSKWHLVLCQ